MSRRDLAHLLICAGVILASVQVIGYTSQAGAVLLALAIGGALWQLFARDRH